MLYRYPADISREQAQKFEQGRSFIPYHLRGTERLKKMKRAGLRPEQILDEFQHDRDWTHVCTREGVILALDLTVPLEGLDYSDEDLPKLLEMDRKTILQASGFILDQLMRWYPEHFTSGHVRGFLLGSKYVGRLEWGTAERNWPIIEHHTQFWRVFAGEPIHPDYPFPQVLVQEVPRSLHKDMDQRLILTSEKHFTEAMFDPDHYREKVLPAMAAMREDFARKVKAGILPKAWECDTDHHPNYDPNRGDTRPELKRRDALVAFKAS